jgi:hypothetical protein
MISHRAHPDTLSRYPLEAVGLLPLAVGVGRAQNGPTTTERGRWASGSCSEPEVERAPCAELKAGASLEASGAARNTDVLERTETATMLTFTGSWTSVFYGRRR